MGLRAPSSDDRMSLSEERRATQAWHPSREVRPRLGIGAIVGESFSIFFRRIHWFAILAFVPQLAAGLMVIVAIGGVAGYAELMAASLDPNGFAGGGGWMIFLLMAGAVVLTMLVPLALSVLAAYDAKLGRPFRLGRYLTAGLAPIVPLLVCWVLVMILWLAASMFLLVPGLWVLSVFSVVTPAIVIERAGFGGLGRSIGLTKGYRWPILGAMILIVLVAILVGFVMSLATLAAQTALLPLLTGAGTGTGIVALGVGTVLQSLNLAVSYGLPCVGVALIYARLREIKEGTGVESLAEVFA